MSAKKAAKNAPVKESKVRSVAGKGKAVPLAEENNGAESEDGKQEDGNAAEKEIKASPENRRPDPRDVVQLATQLVSAQIMASSYHDTAMGLLNEVRQMAFDLVEAIHDGRRSESSDSGDPHFQIGMDVMNRSRMERRRMRKTRMLEPMSHTDLDRLFQSAMRRAYVMLNTPYDPERLVFAEQLFSPTEVLTEGAIRQRFIDFRWPGLKSGTSVFNLMRKVNTWFVKELDDLRARRQAVDGKASITATDPSIPIHTRIEAEAARLSWLLEQVRQVENPDPHAIMTYGDLSSALSNFIQTKNGMDIAGYFQSHDALERNNLIMAMFNPSGPQKHPVKKRSKGRKKQGDGTASDEESSITYRPWAIFRYLRRHGRRTDDELGRALNHQLRTKRCLLNPKMVPDIPGVAPAEFEYGPLHEEVECLLDYYKEEGAFSDSGWNADELELHGCDADSASELNRPDLNNDGIAKF